MKLPHKYRGAALLSLLLIVLPCTAWHFALHDTFRTWLNCRQIASQLAEIAPAPETQHSIPTDSRELILSGALLDVVRRTAAEGNTQVTAYEPLITAEQDGIAVHTAQLTLTGGYIPLLRIVGALTHTLPQCRIYSLAWRSTTDRQTRRQQLSATLYIQQIVLKTP